MGMLQAAGFIAWHYTTTSRFMEMLKARALVPGASASVDEGPSRLRPITWFSVNDDVEPTAYHGDPARGGEGLVRLGVAVRKLLTCAELRRRAMMPAEVWDHLCEEALSVGSDPDQWFGCMHRIALADCIVEVRDESGQWRRMPVPTTRHKRARTGEGSGTDHHHAG